jgi:hypothetical protein
LGLSISVHAVAPERDFSGKWVLDDSASNLRSIGPADASFSVSQGDAGILCTAGSVSWSYALDGSETRKRIGGESRSSVAKWEGAALLINALISGPEEYTVMDRWVLSGDRNVLTITRQVVRKGEQAEGRLTYRREETFAGDRTADFPPPAALSPPAALVKRSEPGVPPDVTVPTGTRVLLSLVGEVSTKHAKDGDNVYLRTDAPMAANGRVVIPRGSDVRGTITHTKKAGHVSGKGELFIRFDSLILPNGVQRDFHARPPGDEGKVEGHGKAADPGMVMAGAGMGATIGAITRGLPGAGVGGAAGALAGVLLSRNQDVVLRPGTHVEMVLDRDLVFHPDELERIR